MTSDATAAADQSPCGHILQVCPRTHALGIARHDKVVDLVQKRSSTVFAVNRQYQLQQVFEGWT